MAAPIPRTSSTAYLDHAATTPVLPEVAEVLARHLTTRGNPSSLHGSGRAARRVVEEARENLASHLGASAGEVVFTSGGTEADNLAVAGIATARRAEDPARTGVITSSVEHHAVLDPVQALAQDGFDVTLLPVDDCGRVDPEALVVDRTTALISVMAANNEVGTLQPLAQLVSAAGDVPVHSDAVQAIAYQDVDFEASGLAALSLSGHKLGAPAGVGALLVRRGVPLRPLVHGGGQERGLRSGTVPVAQVAALAVAVELAVRRRETEQARLRGLRDDLERRLLEAVADARLNGHPDDRLPGVSNVTLPGCEGDSLLMLLDAAGVECSTGSACAAGVARASHVLLAMGRSEADARSSLRFSLGHGSSAADVDRLVTALPAAVARARAAGSVMRGVA